MSWVPYPSRHTCQVLVQKKTGPFFFIFIFLQAGHDVNAVEQLARRLGQPAEVACGAWSLPGVPKGAAGAARALREAWAFANRRAVNLLVSPSILAYVPGPGAKKTKKTGPFFFYQPPGTSNPVSSLHGDCFSQHQLLPGPGLFPANWTVLDMHWHFCGLEAERRRGKRKKDNIFRVFLLSTFL